MPLNLSSYPFVLKNNAKRWLYILPTNSISKWDEFVKIFLKKFYLMHKPTRMRNAINQFQQVGGEPLWKYPERFKDLHLMPSSRQMVIVPSCLRGDRLYI